MTSKKQPKKKPLFQEVELGPLPVDVINATLEMELGPGKVVLTAAVQVHASRRHPEYPQCLPYLGTVLSSPLYIGDDGKNIDKIELISRVPSLGGGLLVAISLELDEKGRYRICSLYSVKEAKLQTRRERGFLKLTKTPKEKGPA